MMVRGRIMVLSPWGSGGGTEVPPPNGSLLLNDRAGREDVDGRSLLILTRLAEVDNLGQEVIALGVPHLREILVEFSRRDFHPREEGVDEAMHERSTRFVRESLSGCAHTVERQNDLLGRFDVGRRKVGMDVGRSDYRLARWLVCHEAKPSPEKVPNPNPGDIGTRL
jgi:hypothetical protein